MIVQIVHMSVLSEIHSVTVRALRPKIDAHYNRISPTLLALMANSNPQIECPEPLKTLVWGRPWMDLA